jgi:hypothetical protein
MRRLLLSVAALASLALAAPTRPADAATSVSVSVNIGDPYRGASLHFRSEPDVVLIPSSDVYYARNYDRDLYRHGRYWYFVEDGRWFRARSYRGPFIRVSYSSVPRQVLYVPTRYRRNWGGPPAHAPAWGYHKNKNQDRDARVGDWYRNDRDGWDQDGHDRDGRDRDGRDRDGRDRDGRDRDRDGRDGGRDGRYRDRS